MLGGPGSLALVGMTDCDEDAEKVVLARAREPPAGEIKETQFNFGLDDNTLCAVASGSRVFLYTWGRAGDPVKKSCLRGHTREVMDLSWHEQEHHWLATW